MPQLLGIGHPGEVAERLGDGLVGDADDSVAGAVEDERAVPRGLVRELPHEPALAGSGLPGDERDAPALAAPAGHEGAQERELAGPADEREGRRQAQRAGELGCRIERRHSQI